jgi:hypothetical protein
VVGPRCGAVEPGLRLGSEALRLARLLFSHLRHELYWRRPGLFNLLFSSAFIVFSANMVCKMFIALPLVVLLHFIE